MRKKPLLTLAEFTERFRTTAEPIGECGYVLIPFRSTTSLADNDLSYRLIWRIAGYRVNSFNSCTGFTLAPQCNS